MTSIRLKCFLVLVLLSVIGFGPLSITALLGMYVVLRRPGWFFEVVEGLYRDAASNAPGGIPVAASGRMDAAIGTRSRCFLALLLLMVLDIAPVPVVGGIGLYVVTRRPRWFLALVNRIYGRRAAHGCIDDLARPSC